MSQTFLLEQITLEKVQECLNKKSSEIPKNSDEILGKVKNNNFVPNFVPELPFLSLIRKSGITSWATSHPGLPIYIHVGVITSDLSGTFLSSHTLSLTSRHLIQKADMYLFHSPNRQAYTLHRLPPFTYLPNYLIVFANVRIMHS